MMRRPVAHISSSWTRVPSGQARPWNLLLLLTAGLLLVAQGRAHALIPGLQAIRPALLLGVAGLVVWMLQGNPVARLGRPVPLGVKLALFFWFWAAVGVPFALWQGRAFSSVTGSFATTMIVFLLVVASIRHVTDVRRLLGAFAIGGAIYAFLAPLEMRVGIRGFGAGGYDPNDSAMFLASAIPVLAFFALSSKRLLWRIAAGVSALAAIAAIVDTQSRGGFLALAAVLLFMLLFFRGVSVGAKLMVVAIACLGLATTAGSEYWERMETIQALDDGYGETGVGGRRNIWARGIGYMIQNPVTGVGIDNFAVAEGQSPVIRERIRRGIGTQYQAAHSMWVQVAAELGVPGIVAFLLLFGHVARQMWTISSAARRGPPLREARDVALMASAILGSLVGIAVAGSFLSNQYWAMVWVPLALGIALARLDAGPPRLLPNGIPASNRWPVARARPGVPSSSMSSRRAHSYGPRSRGGNG